MESNSTHQTQTTTQPEFQAAPQQVAYQQPPQPLNPMANVIMHPAPVQPQYQTPVSQPQESYPQANLGKETTSNNPWKEAFNRVVGLLSTPVHSPSQAEQSTIQPNNGRTYNNGAAYQQPQAYQQTYNPTQASSNNYSQPSLGQQNAYPSDQEVLNAIAPSVLNKYACDLEDTLQVYGQKLGETQQFAQYQHDVIEKLAPHIERYKAMETLLLDPNLLAAYVNDYFTHVVPVQSTTEQQAQAQTQGLVQARPQFPAMPDAQGNSGRINLSDVRPDQRYLIADQMEANGMFSGKRLVVE